MIRLHLTLIAFLAFLAGWASRDATVIWASGPEPYLGDPLVVPPGDVRLLDLGTGATGGILTPTPLPPDGCTWGGWCDDQPGVDTIPAVPLPPALWMLAGAVGVLAMIGRRR